MYLKIADLGISFADTGLVDAVILFLIGYVAMVMYDKLDGIRYKRDKEIDRFIRKENRFCHRPKPQNLKDN